MSDKPWVVYDERHDVVIRCYANYSDAETHVAELEADGDCSEGCLFVIHERDLANE